MPVYTTAVVEQPWDDYDATDHQTWATLFQRQMAILPGRACREHLQALDGLRMSADRIPGSATSTACWRRRPAGPWSRSRACCPS